MEVYAKACISRFVVDTGLEAEMIMNNINSNEWHLIILLYLRSKFYIRMFGVQILFEIGDINLTFEKKESIINVPSIKVRFKLRRTFREPLSLFETHKGVCQYGAQTTAHTNTV